MNAIGRVVATIGSFRGAGSVILFSFAAISPAAAQTCVQPPSNLVSWWPADGNASDIQDGNHGTLVSGATFAPGLVGQAFRLTGSLNSGVRVPSSANLDPAEAITLDAWVYPFSFPNGAPSILRRQGNSPTVNNQYLIAAGSGSTAGVAHCNIGDFANPVGGTIPLNQWTHVTCTYDRQFARLYVNGVQVTAQPRTQPIPASSRDLWIGNWEFQSSRQFDGLIDEVEIFNRALTAEEVQAIHASGSAGKCKAPDADAGADQAVDEGTIVILDGSQSTGLNPSYLWEQIAGPSVVLTGETTTNPSFEAPLLSGGVDGNQTLTFELTVSASSGLSDSDTVDVTVKNLNHAPVADAGQDQQVSESSSVALSATNSYDPDGDAIACAWVQTCGSAVTLDGDTTCDPSFTAPLVPGGAGGSETLCFEVHVSDSALSATDDVQVTVEQVNHAPVANAGPDQTRFEGSRVVLDGTASSDPDGDPFTCSWTQVSGPTVLLSDPAVCAPSFTAPAVDPGGDTLVLRLVVSDSQLQSLPDDVSISVRNLNDPPACTLAQASQGSLWPPNHKLVSVGITGVSDPDTNQVSIAITGVTQDEPVNGLGDGDTSPDAVPQGSTVLLRAERSGTGNGRVYRVQFTADDGQGGICSGTVTVGVPKSMQSGTPIDDGQLHDSTQP